MDRSIQVCIEGILGAPRIPLGCILGWQLLRFTRAVMGGRQSGMYLHKRINSTVKDAPAPQSVVKDSSADDILIGAKRAPVPGVDPHEQLVRDSVAALKSVLLLLAAAGGRIKLSKCWFLSRVGQLVGYVTDGVTVSTEPSRFAVLDASAPLDAVTEAMIATCRARLGLP